MDNVCGELARFTLETKWDDLPGNVVHETKLLLLDSIGVALAAITTDPGKMAIALSKRYGGPPESSIIGVRGKLSCSSAVMANGQLINILDFDANMSAEHCPPYIIPTPLALAESIDASGKDLILATSLGFEVATRVSKALPDNREAKIRHGYSSHNFGATVGGARLLKLDKSKIMHALGLAGHLSQVLTWIRFKNSEPRAMSKYGMPGWQNTGAVNAVLLSEMGYQGDITVFDSKEGFWKFCGYEGWQPEKITAELGKEWAYSDVRFKVYPCCGATLNSLNSFINIIEQNHILPEEIESVKITGVPDFNFPLFTNKALTSIVDVQFGIPYILAVAAHRTKVGVEWQDWDTVTNPQIETFAKKVIAQGDVNLDAKRTARVEIIARGKSFSEETGGRRGAGVSDEVLIAKFRHNASRILTQSQINRAVDATMGLERLEHISELMANITP
jgi:2-methylcitrate dehydratase PrpD